MGWSWKIGRIAGIDVYMHFTFLILLAWLAVAHYLRGGIDQALYIVLVILALFGVIVLHELGHALAARRYGIQTRDITLLPIGGVARLERMPDNPLEELIVALAGPAVNVVIAASLAVGFWIRGRTLPLDEVTDLGGGFLAFMLQVNVWLVLFNLIPAFPMDGGRVLRALLAMRMSYVRATQAAARVGQFLALMFGFVGLLNGSPMLVFIALFVWIGAAEEAMAVRVRAALAGTTVKDAMMRDYVVLGPSDSLRVAADHILDGFQHDFPVVDEGKLVGILPRADLIRGLASTGFEGQVSDVMRRDFSPARPNDPVDGMLAQLRSEACPVMPVLEDGRLVGLLTAENVSELLMIREAVAQPRPPCPPRPPRPVEEPPLHV
jgi:Zn-dependent protease/predicted transcriptional regulator